MSNYYDMTGAHDCESKVKNTLYKIGMFAGMNRVTIKALRYYDEQGLLKPAYVDEENGYRYYILSQNADLHQIIALRNMGFSIEEIKKIQEGKSEQELLQVKKRELLKEIAALTAKLAQIESYLSDEDNEVAEHVLVKRIPEVIVASMRHTVENYSELFDLVPLLGQEMERLNCECAMPEYCFTQYLEPEYKDENIQIEICEAVTEKKEDSGALTFQICPEVPEAACIFHKGSYADLPKTYSKILKHIEENGYEICGKIRENYIDGIWNKDTPKEWLTEIQIPVHKI